MEKDRRTARELERMIEARLNFVARVSITGRGDEWVVAVARWGTTDNLGEVNRQAQGIAAELRRHYSLA